MDASGGGVDTCGDEEVRVEKKKTAEKKRQMGASFDFLEVIRNYWR